MDTQSTGGRWPNVIRDHRHLLILGLAVFLLVYLSSFTPGYGYFIDEFYYIACAYHPAFGYVDHPPLAPLLLTIVQGLFGPSLFVIRLLPALAASATVFCTGLLTKSIGGGTSAQLLAACTMAAAPTVLAFGGFYSMNAFEPLIAVLLLLQCVRMIKENEPRRWVGAGILMGLGVMNKHTFGVFILALVFSLLVAGQWRLFLNRWFLFGGICALLITLPNLIWQAANGYPSLEFYRNINTDKNVYTPPVAFIMGQVMGMSPSTVPVWLAGTLFLLLSGRMKQFRFLGILFIALFLFMMISGTSRSDRLMFAYPPVFAAGGLLLEDLFTRYRVRWLKWPVIASLFAGVALALPVILPYFTYEQVYAHTQRLGLNTEIERGKKPPLPQLLADRIGWEEKVALVVRAYNSLPAEDRERTIVAAGNYGQAGAIELFGKREGLPEVACAHNNYYLWSKGRLHGTILLQLAHNGDAEWLRGRFGSVEPAGEIFRNPYVSDHENNLEVFVCREPRQPFAELLEKSKNFH